MAALNARTWELFQRDRRKVTDTLGERIGTGFAFTEGPVWLTVEAAAHNGLGDDTAGLYFSDIDDDTTYFGTCDGLTVVRLPSGRSNGNALDACGRIVSCEHDGRRVARNESPSSVNDEWATVVDSTGGRRLNSPNDLCCRADGVILFSDPSYGVEDAEREVDVQGVYAVGDRLGTVLIDGDRAKPNGLALDPRHANVFWLADTERGEIVRYRLSTDFTATEIDIARGFDRPDGLAFDDDHNLLVAVVEGIAVLRADTTDSTLSPSPAARLAIQMQERPANLCFGDGSLYVCARTSVWRFNWPTDELIVATGDRAVRR